MSAISLSIKDSELQFIDKYVFQTCDLSLTELRSDFESQEYAAQDFELQNMKCKYRAAKITPKKIGQFVTLWHRTADGVTAPFDITDPIDFYIIATRSGQNNGLFIFPKTILYKKGVLSGNGKEGKRGFRVYPNWDVPQNKQAQQTQSWQKIYFLEIIPDQAIDVIRVRHLFDI